jgi:chemosensory pili system protein ChpA (sensor histidine kinase/response regulator)
LHVEDTVVVAQPDVVEPTVEVADIQVSYTQKDDDSLAMDDDLQGWMLESIGFEEKTSVMDDWLSDLENLADATEQAVLMAEETHKIDVVTDQSDVSHPKASSADDARSTSLHVEDTVVVAQPDVAVADVEMDAPEEVIRLSKQHLPDALASIAVPVSVMDDLNDDILSIFIDEASEIFSQIYSFVDGWKTDEGEASSESKKLLKRALHTLKGSSRMAGCMRFGSFIHNMEHIMEVGESVSGISFGDLPDLISMACDVAAQEVEYIQNYESAFVRNSSVAADKPVQAIESNRVELAPEANKEKIVAVIPQKEISSAAANMSSHSSVSNTIRVPIERMEKMSMCLAQTGMIHQRVVAGLGRSRLSLNDLTDNLDRLRRLVSEVEIQAEIQMQSRKEMMGSDFDPLEFDRFTRLQELTRMVTESIHDISMVQGNMEKGLVDTVDAVEEQNMVTDDLRYEVMHSRLLPIQSLTMRMERVVRQACRDSGKQADLIINGEVEIDSGVLNSVIAPLEHLIRNAVAHGVESPEKRKAQGKNERGIIILQVTQHGNEIHIELSDDGAGINRQAVEKKARERGLLANGDSLTQERANEMIFSSGFSTSESVTQLSGRGVGMDVVRGEVIKMGGWIQVSSMEGEGTSFHITIPSYMAIMSLAPVHSNGVEYCIPTSLVKDVRIAPQDELKAAYATGSIVFDGVNVPLYNFDRIMSVKNDVNLVRNNIIMLLEEYGKLMAFHIDMVGPDVNLVVRPLHKSVAAIPGIIGASVGGDGNPLWIVNPIRMNHPEESRVINFNAVASVNKQTYERVSGKTVEQILVMVVDDSLTVRKVTDKFLTREGYKVVTAKDGMDALEKLQEVQPDIFLLDIEMPRMDGFELAATLNSMEKTRDIPIIMISSRNIEKHQDHAKSLGVKEYLGKPYKENELLFHIQNLTQHEATHMISLND